MKKINLEVIKPWIGKRISDLLGMEDEVVNEFVFNQLEEQVSSVSTLKREFNKFVNCRTQTLAVSVSDRMLKSISQPEPIISKFYQKLTFKIIETNCIYSNVLVLIMVSTFYSLVIMLVDWSDYLCSIQMEDESRLILLDFSMERMPEYSVGSYGICSFQLKKVNLVSLRLSLI